jgi:hypothetical protein
MGRKLFALHVSALSPRGLVAAHTGGTTVALSPAMNNTNFVSIDSSNLTNVSGGACGATPAARIKAAGDSVDFGVGSPQNKEAFACLKPAERRQLAKLNPTSGNPFDPSHNR